METFQNIATLSLSELIYRRWKNFEFAGVLKKSYVCPLALVTPYSLFAEISPRVDSLFFFKILIEVLLLLLK